MLHTKHAICALLSLALVLSLPSVSLGAEGTTFVDISPGDWFAPYVEVCVKEGLLEGPGEGAFQPERSLSTAEALVLAARLCWRLEGGLGPLPQGGSPEELYRLVGYEEESVIPQDKWNTQFEDLLKLDWAWDGVFYLTKQFRATFGSDSTTFYDLEGSAAREDLAELLALPVERLDPKRINAVETLPDVEWERNPEVYRLYEAGILTGMDPYGSFGGGCSLSRAEAAAIAARFLRPELRVSFTPAPLPDSGYTLTYLMDGSSWLTYPMALVNYTDEEGEYANCFLTLEGERLPWPEGTEEGVPSFGLNRDREYVSLLPWDRSGGDYYGTKMGLMDRSGAMVIPFGRFHDIFATDDGHFIGRLTDNAPSMAKTRVFLLSPKGEVEWELPSYYGTPDNDWRDFNQGVCPWVDEETGLWGYMDRTGTWTIPPTWSSASAFRQGFAVVSVDGMEGLINLQGEYALPPAYEWLYVGYNSPSYRGDTVIWFHDRQGNRGWLTSTGKRLPAGAIIGEETSYQNGYFTYCGVYYDLSMQPVSQKFDWAGPITADGQGFVGMDQKIYRIQFEK